MFEFFWKEKTSENSNKKKLIIFDYDGVIFDYRKNRVTQLTKDILNSYKIQKINLAIASQNGNLAKKDHYHRKLVDTVVAEFPEEIMKRYMWSPDCGEKLAQHKTNQIKTILEMYDDLDIVLFLDDLQSNCEETAKTFPNVKVRNVLNGGLSLDDVLWIDENLNLED